MPCEFLMDSQGIMLCIQNNLQKYEWLVFQCKSMQEKLPVAGSLYTKVCNKSCRWQVLCIYEN